ncbi:MAG: hypothetical protein PHR83_06660 [Paludibacter sp.]|nr:hypothetical protein [Paludibacter sp.]
MHKTLKILLLSIIMSSGFFGVYAGNPNKTYYIKYILDSNGYAISSETELTVTPTRIYIVRNGENKYWDCEYRGQTFDEPKSGKRVYFHNFYLTNKNVYISISDYKLVKHNNVFYYRIVFAGQTQLAL